MIALPVYVLTGYLGSGKTTLLNHLLGQAPLAHQRVALVINEFGTLGVDSQLVRKTAGGVFEINSGSLFCACTRSGLVKVLQKIASEIRPDVVLAEATGVAETSDLYDLLDTPPLRDRFHIQANVCVIDSLNFTKILPYLKAARTQVASADGVVMNKIELLDETGVARLSALLKGINTQAEQARVTHGGLEWAFVEGLKHVRRTNAMTQTPPEEIVTCSIPNRQANRDRLTAAIHALGDKLLRLKGIVDFGEGPCLMESVFGTVNCHPLVKGQARYGITALGWRISKDELCRTLESAFLAGAKSLIQIELK